MRGLLLVPLLLSAVPATASPAFAGAPIVERALLGKCAPNTRCLESFGDPDAPPPMRSRLRHEGAPESGRPSHGPAVFLLYVAFCVAVGFFWASKGRSLIAGVLWSFFLSPLVGLVLGFAAGRNIDAIEERAIASGGTTLCPLCGGVIDAGTALCPHCDKPLPG